MSHDPCTQVEDEISGGMPVLAGIFLNGSSPSPSRSYLFNHPHPSAEISRGPNQGDRMAPYNIRMGWRD